MAERLRLGIREVFAGDEVPLSISFGIATFPVHAADGPGVLRAADQALYSAKEKGRDRSVVFSEQASKSLEGARQRLADSSEMQLATVVGLAEALDIRDTGTGEHSRTVARYAGMMARRMGFAGQRVERIELAGLLHDVGKIGISDSVLTKPGPLDDEEWKQMRTHPQIGARLLGRPELADLRGWIVAHHERPDGKGYPFGLSHGDIPLEARILSVADAYEAMTADRVYKRAMAAEAARAGAAGLRGHPVRRRGGQRVPPGARGGGDRGGHGLRTGGRSGHVARPGRARRPPARARPAWACAPAAASGPPGCGRRTSASATCSPSVRETFAAELVAQQRRSARCPAAARGSVPIARRTRFTITPPKGRSSSRRRLANHSASRIEASRGEVTSRNVVRLSPSSASTCRARSEKPSVMLAEGVEEVRQVAQQVHAGGPLHDREQHPGAACPSAPRPILLELWKKRSERESMKRDSRRGASRKSSALRLGGVSSTSRS